ncbi:hypothetical protein JOF56_006668 [Kibdelosporangium banguiense]|uniref:ATP-binding protein n=1 Tax=Kibdelosporangium banguiense TaxID=1365924 RepID=A0ABS4TPE9_9PSEU|nr:hypothetical protein [Kibdelosporangium banguiense]MBP2326283.1 hypothetical protein [Kibdelosporangium banguiense]
MIEPLEQAHAINPFLLPPCGGVRSKPLCPWRDPEHESYYVAIADSQDAFEKFKARMTDVVSLQQRGHFVLVVGEQRCGKTSLINRCVHWLDGALPKTGVRPVRVDLTGGAPIGKPQSAANRMKFVCERIRDELEVGDQLLTDNDLEKLAAMTDQPERFFPRLGRVLADSVVLVVLVPRIHELMDEVLDYASMVGQRMILLSESSLLSGKDVLAAADPETQPLVLDVGELKTDDAIAFVRARLARPGIYPMVADEVFEWLRNEQLKFYTIGSLQSVFSRLYGDLLENDPTYGTDRTVAPPEIVRALLRYLRENGD